MTIVTAVPVKLNYGTSNVNLYYAQKGQGIPRHEHPHRHATLVVAGSIVVRKEGKEKVVAKGDNAISLVENEWHEIEAIEDGTIFINVFTLQTQPA